MKFVNVAASIRAPLLAMMFHLSRGATVINFPDSVTFNLNSFREWSAAEWIFFLTWILCCLVVALLSGAIFAFALAKLSKSKCDTLEEEKGYFRVSDSFPGRK